MHYKIHSILLAIIISLFTACGGEQAKEQPSAGDDNSVPITGKTPEQLVEEALAREREKYRLDSIERYELAAMEDEIKRLELIRIQDSIDAVLAEQKAEIDRLEQQRLVEIARREAEDAGRDAEAAAAEARRINTNRNRQIKITMVKLVNVISDDEGPGNDADMHKFRFTINSTPGGCAAGANPSAQVNGLTLYEYNGPERTVSEGSTWPDQNKSVTIVYDNESCSLGSLRLKIIGYALEEDNGSSSADEIANQSWNLAGNEIFGTHNFSLADSNDSPDFKYNCIFRIEKIGVW